MRLRLPRPTLSLRITVTFALGALLVSAAVAASAYLVTKSFVVSQQQRTTARQTYLNAAIVRDRLRDPHADLPGILDELTTSSTSKTLIYSSGRWYTSSLLVTRDSLPARVRTEVLAGQPVRAWARISGAPRIVVGIPLPAVGGAYFQVFDEAPLARTLTVLRTALVAAAAAATAAGAATGWWASRRLTAPLRAVSEAARTLAAGDFDARLSAEHDLELAGLVDSFNSMVSALRDRVERDARFAADVSHELRSPLTTLSTSLSVLRGRRNELSSRGQEALDLVSAEVDRFERLVEDLLEISRGDARHGLADVEPVRLSQLVLNLLDRTEYSGVIGEFDADALDVIVQGDKRRLEQVLRNLLDNASRHAGGASRVSAAAEAGFVTLYVDDAGPGVPPEERERIFDRFTRGRNAARRGSHPGSGLGLALVREHVRAHGGETWVTEAPGGGARFAVRLPTQVRA